MKSSKQPNKKTTLGLSPGSKKSATKLQIVNYVLIGIVLGILAFALLRFATYQQPKHTHYHANFAVYANSQQVTFNDPSFYEEVASCSKYDTEQNNPLHRAHMHDNVYDVVHIHADGVTWEQFFENINSAAQPGFLRIHNSQYINNDEAKVTYILNGKALDSLNSIVIGDQDKLLVSYGNESSEVLQQRYDAIENKAKANDETKDPASCSGDQPATLQDRLNNILF